MSVEEKAPEVPVSAPLSVVSPPTPKLVLTYPEELIVTPVVASILRRRSETAGVAAEETARISPEGCWRTPAPGLVNVLRTVVPVVIVPEIAQFPVSSRARCKLGIGYGSFCLLLNLKSIAKRPVICGY